MTEAFIVDGVRTPIGCYGGAPAHTRPDDLAALVVREAVSRAGVVPELIDEVVLGAANQAGEDNRNVARMAALLVGLPQSVPGFTVNRLCASGLTAIATARQMIAAGDADLGGAIALGHPLGCSGTRLVVTLLGRLEQAGERRGLATMCVGVGQGAALVVERP